MTCGLDPHVPLRASGIPWLGKIPAHWGIWKIGHFAAVGNGSTPSRDNAEYWTEGLIPWLNSSVVNQEEVTEADQFITEMAFRECHLPLVKSGSVLVGITGQGKTRGQAAVLSFEATINQHLAFITPKKGLVNPWFLRWALFAAYDFLRSISDDAGGTKGALTCEEVGALRMPLPPIDEQRAIADYLNRETARLDGLVAAKERVLGLVAEKRRALITHAVTCGIDPCAPLRDSGISWLGKIPAHWDTRRVAWLFRDRDERGQPDLPLLEVSINTGVVLREFSDDRIESTAADFNTYKVARKGDIVFNKMRMWQGAVGVAPEDGLVSPDYTVAAPSGALSSDYAGQLFRTEKFSAECARRSHGIVWDRLRLYWEGFRDIQVPLPPLDEQHTILAHILRETAKLDALRAATERTIALLKERRAALIAAAVTGQIEVEEAA